MYKKQINNLIIALLIIANYAKDIHYNCPGTAFYGNHLFVDKISENMYEYIDQLKEICLLGRGIKPLNSSEYLEEAYSKIPEAISFENMRGILADTLNFIEELQDLSRGEENLIGDIAQDVQNSIGLLNIKDPK